MPETDSFFTETNCHTEVIVLIPIELRWTRWIKGKYYYINGRSFTLVSSLVSLTWSALDLECWISAIPLVKEIAAAPSPDLPTNSWLSPELFEIHG